MLDRLTPAQRHLILLLIAGSLGVAGDAMHLLDLPPTLAPLAAAFITSALAYLTPLTKAYGVGSQQAVDDGLPEDPWTEDEPEEPDDFDDNGIYGDPDEPADPDDVVEPEK